MQAINGFCPPGVPG